MQVSLRHVVFPGLVPIEIASQENSFSLAAGLWLDDKCLCLSVIKLLLEGLYVSWQKPGLWEEVVRLREVFLHGYQIFGKQVLPRESVHSWEVVCTLVTLHLDQKSRDSRPIYEPNVPVFLLIYACPQVARLRDLVNQLILSVCDVEH